MSGRVMEVSNVVVDLVPGKLLLAQATLGRELRDVINDRKSGIHHFSQIRVLPVRNSVALKHVAGNVLGGEGVGTE